MYYKLIFVFDCNYLINYVDFFKSSYNCHKNNIEFLGISNSHVNRFPTWFSSDFYTEISCLIC